MNEHEAARAALVPRRILVSGSRSLDAGVLIQKGATVRTIKSAQEAHRRFILSLEAAVLRLATTDAGVHPVVIVHGAARFGADKWADRWLFDVWDDARFRRDNLHVERHSAKWDKHGKAAGIIRNGEMVARMDPAVPHAVIACWDGKSTGTKNLIDRAEIAGLEVTRSWL